MDFITIVCFLWNGDRWAVMKDGGPMYVNILYRMVKRNLSMPFRFVCFTNVHSNYFDKRIEVLHFDPPSWMGCLPKLWMYNPEAGLKGQVLSLDIDVIIVGPLDDMASYRGDFCVRSKFAPGQAHKADGDIVGFRAEAMAGLWEALARDPEGAEASTGGRERYFYRQHDACQDRWQDLYPGQVLSYKRHVRRAGKLPKGAVIVSCHGRPRPHEIAEPWAEECWR